MSVINNRLAGNFFCKHRPFNFNVRLSIMPVHMVILQLTAGSGGQSSEKQHAAGTLY